MKPALALVGRGIGPATRYGDFDHNQRLERMLRSERSESCLLPARPCLLNQLDRQVSSTEVSCTSSASSLRGGTKV